MAIGMGLCVRHNTQDIFQKIKKHIPLAGKSIEELRGSFSKLCLAFDSGQELIKERVRIDGFDAFWMYPEGTPEGPVILFMHGGAFMLGSSFDHMEIIGHLSGFSGIRVLSIDYRLAPEHPFPVPNNDCLDAYLWLTQRGFSPHEIVLAGNSAGGTLVLDTLLKLRDTGHPLPAGGYCMSPGTNMNCDYDSIKNNLQTDWLTMDTFTGIRLLYLAGANPNLPELSPICADLNGLTPLLLQAGAREMLLDDSVCFTEKAKQSGVDITLEIWDGMFHCWHLFASALPQGQEALESGARFIRRLLKA
jgi:epsilon-lactone hydrolase